MGRRKHSSYKRFQRKAFFRDKKTLVMVAAALLAIVIVGAAVFIMYNSNDEDKIVYEEMGDCTLPTITMKYAGNDINRLYGYTKEMSLQFMRDTIYAMEDGYTIDIEIQAYENEIKDLSYAIFDIEENKLIQKNQARNLRDAGDGTYDAEIVVENLITEGKEYYAELDLVDGSGRKLYYYTRIMKNTTTPLPSLMELVRQHHNAMFDDDGEEFLANFQKTNSAVNDSTNLGFISLSSNVKAMSWGTMGVKPLDEPMVSIVDLDNNMAFFRVDYQVGRTKDGIREYYNVSEYYRTISNGTNKMDIISYERSVNEIFIPMASDVGNKSVLLGIVKDLNIPTKNNPKGNLNVFIADKSIWYMNTDTKKLTKVFSFETSPTDIRQNYAQHDIKLLKVADDGIIQFLVYGYMNRGIHEGEVGIGLYTYSCDDGKVTEDIFIPSNLPYQILKNSIRNLCYLNNDNILYIMLDEYVYALDLDKNKSTLVASGLNEFNFKVSTSGRMLAWQDGALENNAVKIIVMDLEEQTEFFVSARKDCNIKVLGFLNIDLVYGEGSSGNTYTTAEGNEYLLMKDLYVVNNKNVVQSEEHSNNGYFVTSVVEYNRVVVNRVARVGNNYKKTDEFTLFATDLEGYKEASAYNTYDEDRRTINYIEFVNTMDPNRPAEIDSVMDIVMCSAETTDVSNMLSDEGKYYIYAGGEITAILTNPADAILRAYYDTGVAITSKGEYFYKRTSRPFTVELTDVSIKKAISAYRDKTAINVTGIYLTQALYFTGRKIPVVWEWGDATYVIYGYDLYDNIMLYNINGGDTILVAYDDIDPIFDEVGRCFIVQ